MDMLRFHKFTIGALQLASASAMSIKRVSSPSPLTHDCHCNLVRAPLSFCALLSEAVRLLTISLSVRCRASQRLPLAAALYTLHT